MMIKKWSGEKKRNENEKRKVRRWNEEAKIEKWKDEKWKWKISLTSGTLSFSSCWLFPDVNVLWNEPKKGLNFEICPQGWFETENRRPTSGVIVTAIWTLPGELYALDLSKPTTLIHILPLLTLIVPNKMCLNDTSIFYLLNSILFASS